MDEIAQLLQLRRPMPSTSPSWSTLVNRPFASRQAMIAAAVTGPTPGSVSSSSTVAAFRSTKPASRRRLPAVDGASVGAAVARRPDRTAHPDGSPGAATMPTMICSPSVTRQAMLSRSDRPIQNAAGHGERVGGPCAGRHRDEPRLVHEARHADVHGPSALARRRSRAGRRNRLPRRRLRRCPAAAAHRGVKTATRIAMTPTTPTRRHRPGPGLHGRPRSSSPCDRTWSCRAATATARVGSPSSSASVHCRRPTALQSLGGQFGSHAVKVRAWSDCPATGGVRRRAVDESRMSIAALSTVMRYRSSHSDDHWYRVPVLFAAALPSFRHFPASTSRARHRLACERAFRRDAAQALLVTFRPLALVVVLGSARDHLARPSGYVFTIGSAVVLVEGPSRCGSRRDSPCVPTSSARRRRAPISGIAMMWGPTLTVAASWSLCRSCWRPMMIDSPVARDTRCGLRRRAADRNRRDRRPPAASYRRAGR